MVVSIIAAMDNNRLIGNNNHLPWHLPVDFAHFRAVTMGKPIIMGRKTYESIGKPLPGRINIVLSRNSETRYEGVESVTSFEQALKIAPATDELMVIGGSKVYELLLPKVDRLYITYVDGEFEGDAWFPEIDDKTWRETASKISQADDKNNYGCRFVTLERR